MNNRRAYMNSNSFKRRNTEPIREELRICLNEYAGKEMRSANEERKNKIEQERCVEKLNAFLDCEFKNPVALLLNGLFRKLKRVIISKGGRK